MISPEILINKPHIQPLYTWYTPNSRPGGPKKRSGRFGENIFSILGFGASIGLYYPMFRTPELCWFRKPELGWHSLLSHSRVEHIFSQQYYLEVSSHLAWNAVWMPAVNTWCVLTLFPTSLFPTGQHSVLQVFLLTPHHLVRTWANGHKPYPCHFMAVLHCTPTTHNNQQPGRSQSTQLQHTLQRQFSCSQHKYIS